MPTSPLERESRPCPPPSIECHGLALVAAIEGRLALARPRDLVGEGDRPLDPRHDR